LISKKRNSMAAATAETLLFLKYWVQVPEAFKNELEAPELE
jgi:hypothetical protein